MQEYEDLKPFNKNTFLETVFGSLEGISLESKEEPVTEEPETKEIEEPQKERREILKKIINHRRNL